MTKGLKIKIPDPSHRILKFIRFHILPLMLLGQRCRMEECVRSRNNGEGLCILYFKMFLSSSNSEGVKGGINVYSRCRQLEPEFTCPHKNLFVNYRILCG